MDQPHFISMWKSFYDIFIQQKNEQQAYHSIVSVGTLLIKLGDVGNHRPSSKKKGSISMPNQNLTKDKSPSQQTPRLAGPKNIDPQINEIPSPAPAVPVTLNLGAPKAKTAEEAGLHHADKAKLKVN
jgi:hypothetical protein